VRTSKPNHAIHLNDGTTVIELVRRNGEIFECYLDTSDYPLVKDHHWCAKKDGRPFYAQTNVRKLDRSITKLCMHRMLMPGVKEIDHHDGSGLNNRRSNLRPATRSMNRANQRKRSGCSSRFKGVSWNKRARYWRVQIMVNSEPHHLGYFTSEIDAACAYDTAALKHFGEFAVLNLPKPPSLRESKQCLRPPQALTKKVPLIPREVRGAA
jgi:hypothetical protein